MTPSLVRPETAGDHDLVAAVHADAFGRRAEADLVSELRRNGAMVASLVAEEAGRVVGHAAFSRGLVEPDVAVVTVGPIAVVPARQRAGIGSELMRKGIEACRNGSESALFLVGDPAFYGRFGFSVPAAAPYESPYSGPHLQALVLRSEAVPPEGVLRYPEAFAALG